VDVFSDHDAQIGTTTLSKGLTSDGVLAILRERLVGLGFHVEAGKSLGQKIKWPVCFGESGRPSLQYEIDAFHLHWKCGLEIEAGRAWMGNAVYRDIAQALVMVNLDHLVLAVPNIYKYLTNSKAVASKDYENTVSVAGAIYGHSRITMPFGLTALGY
jgi:hypothetical protein